MRERVVWKEETAKYDADLDRVQVWDAISELFMDSYRTEKELQWLAEIIADTPFSFQELAHIAFVEVGPICLPNSLTWLGGEGMLFSPDWLIPRCLERQKKHAFKPNGNSGDLPIGLSLLIPFFFEPYLMLNRVKRRRQASIAH